MDAALTPSEHMRARATAAGSASTATRQAHCSLSAGTFFPYRLGALVLQLALVTIRIH